MSKFKVAFLLNPLKEMRHKDDTSFALMQECERRGHDVFAFESRDLRLHHSTLDARLSKCRTHSQQGLLPEAPHWKHLEAMDAIVIRKEPPFDLDYLSSMYLLDFIREKTFIMNDPAGVRTINEKIAAIHFPKWAPNTIIGYQADVLIEALKTSKISQWVIKPLFDKGGRGITRVTRQDPNLKQKIQKRTQKSQVPVMMQAYVEHTRQGDKRILLLDGRVLGAFRRVPGKRDFRANMALGGKAHPATVTLKEKQMIRTLRPFLRKHGLWFAGIDMLGESLTEINVTSPAGIPEINRFNRTRLEVPVIDYLEKNARR